MSEQPRVGGNTASVADFATYHPLWLYVRCNRRPLTSGPKVEAWYKWVSEIGHGTREEITHDEAFAAARDAEPRPLPASTPVMPVAIGRMVDVGPSDYGMLPVAGILVAVTEGRIILARENAELGKLHVHFPRVGNLLVSK